MHVNTPTPVTDRVTEPPPGPITPHLAFSNVRFRYGTTLPGACTTLMAAQLTGSGRRSAPPPR
ncbi:hypothetical protein E1295_10365 [Nonomuraea mesophila]|uniref:Uncharacterized protein n=2 Tax=Nonomuraea mesophila TaxID=2530382 RepID=A0A4R5FSZ7_9ACTN|nr:hypothetical protein E1295_10365 [Nonomuraea mesophila]